MPLRVEDLAATPAAPRLEMPVPCASVFDAAGWRFSVDWDGIRAVLALGTDAPARLWDERGRNLGALLPELVGAVGAGNPLARRGAVIDGVVAVLDARGRPDLGALSLLVSRRSSGRFGAGGPRVALLATDLLQLDGAALTRDPLAQRRALLGELLAEPVGPVVGIDDVESEGHAFAAAAAAEGLPAVLARRGEAAYAAGVASPDRLRIALRPRVDAVVVGVVGEPGRRHLLLAETVDRLLRWSGRVAAAAPAEVLAWFETTCRGLRVDEPVAAGVPPVDGRVTWLRPHLVATIAHRDRDGAGVLTTPVLVALRDDRDPAWCCRREPVPPPRDERHAGAFRPMVLRRLPLD